MMLRAKVQSADKMVVNRIRGKYFFSAIMVWRVDKKEKYRMPLARFFVNLSACQTLVKNAANGYKICYAT